MSPKADDIVASVKIVSLNRRFIEPYTIQDAFSSIVCFHQAEIEKVVQGKMVRSTERMPLMMIWDGQNVSYSVAESGKEIEVGEHKYVLDRDIDETPHLPSDDFIVRLSGAEGKELVDKFNPEEYFNEVLSFFEYFFYLPHPMLYRLVSLFAINGSVFDAHDSTPYLYIRSPERGCGKSHLGYAVSAMSNGQMSTNLKAHHLFRIVHGVKTLVAFDEIKGWTGKNQNDKEILEILSLINTGFQRGGSRVPRLEETGKKGKMRTVWYGSYSPKVFITTHLEIPQDTASRCVEIIIQRADPGGVDYGERWFSPEREKRLRRIREMAYIFRLKYGSEIKGVGADPEWRNNLDISNTFDGIKNRELEVFRPLVILTLKFMPTWKDLVANYIRKNLEMRTQLEPTPVNTVLFALRGIYQELTRTGQIYAGDDQIQMVDDPTEGKIIYIPISAILNRIQITTDTMDMGKNPSSRIGKTLKDLGFTIAVRRSNGIVRIIKVDQLQDRCMRYLGRNLGDYKQDSALSQHEKANIVKDILLNHAKTGLMIDHLIAECNGKVPDKEVRGFVKDLQADGYVIVNGKGLIQWMQ